MNHWIFQSKPERYDLRDPGNMVPGTNDTWIASRYRTEMRPGDLVFFWMSGSADERGIYGWGRLSGRPRPDGDGHIVDIRYERRLTHHLPAQHIAAERGLADLLILRIAIGTNFLINRQEAQHIARLLARDERPEIA